VPCGEQGLTPVGPNPTPRILRFGLSAIKCVEFSRSRPISPEPGLIQRHNPARRLHSTVRVQPLAEHQLPARTPPKRIDILMIVPRSKPTKDHLLPVRLSVAVRVGHEPEL